MTKNDNINDIDFGAPATYRIVVKGELSQDWSLRLAGMTITVTTSPSGSSHTELVGLLRDQAQLNGILETLYELHLPILRIEEGAGSDQTANQGNVKMGGQQ